MAGLALLRAPQAAAVQADARGSRLRRRRRVRGGIDDGGASQGGASVANVLTSTSKPDCTYEVELRFLVCDDFGVGQDDIAKGPGLAAFWVLQHERAVGGRFRPYQNTLNLLVRVRGNV